MGSRQRVVIGIVAGALLAGAFLLDWVDVAEQPLPVLYSIPVMVAAHRLTPTATAWFGGVAMVLLAITALVVDTPIPTIATRELFLAIAASLSYLLANRIKDLHAAREEAQREHQVAVQAQALAERKQQESDAARREAEAAQTQLQRFMGVVAHDLRGPITTITGYAQVAAKPNATEERRLHAIGVIRNEIRRMEGLVRDLVDAASAGAGQLQVQPRPIDLTALVCGMAETLHTMYPAHVITCATDQAVEGNWDPDRLSQVLNNLIGNAVKYSPTGGEVDIRLWKEDHHAYVQVSDRGLGMRPEDASRLFEPFSRLAAHADLPGTGLGLYIARVLVEAHGGRIWASSPGPDQGTTFTFCLPMQ